jgi:hypothetical protein
MNRLSVRKSDEEGQIPVVILTTSDDEDILVDEKDSLKACKYLN